MKKLHLLISFILIITLKMSAQVYIELSAVPENMPKDSHIYMAGNFNNWNPADKKYELIKNDKGKYTLDFQTGLNVIEYKFTLGNWDKVECKVDSSDIQNRKTKINQGDSIFVEIEGWKSGIKKHTASKNVGIIDDAFYISQLDRKRRIWIYLPPDYETSNHPYPVFYAHDGQNLFDAATSYSGEWEIDECMDSLFDTEHKSSIIVGIDHGGDYRIEELTPWAHPKYGGGKADLYAEFIVKTLKPYIDRTYRTLSDQKNTGVFGSSLGGLVSFYMALKYPDTFGMVGVFSPSFWFSDKVYEMAEKYNHKNPLKLYILAGGKESNELENEIIKMKQILASKGLNDKNLKVDIIPDGQHSEWFWKREFPKVYQWLNN